MSVSTRRRIGAAALLTAVLAALALPAPALAAEPYDLTLDAGLACDFELGVNISPSEQKVHREFRDADGNIVRILDAGKGDALTFTNLSNGDEVALTSNGFVQRTTKYADGSTTVVSTGHNVVIFFPTDVPAGPSTTLHVGRVVYTTDSDGVFTLKSSSGTERDICAELS